MATVLSFGQRAYLAQQAGFKGDALADILAISQAESGGRPDAMGDLTLQTNTWGPSVGLTQIRSLKAQKGTPADDTRDELANLDPLTNLRHAFVISRGGTDFSPWSTWWGNAKARTGPGQGVFQRFLPAARAGAGTPDPSAPAGGDASTGSAGDASSSTTATAELAGFDPFGIGTAVAKNALKVVVNGVFYTAGAALVVLGVYKTADPGGSVKAHLDQLTQLAPLAAVA